MTRRPATLAVALAVVTAAFSAAPFGGSRVLAQTPGASEQPAATPTPAPSPTPPQPPPVPTPTPGPSPTPTPAPPPAPPIPPGPAPSPVPGPSPKEAAAPRRPVHKAPIQLPYEALPLGVEAMADKVARDPRNTFLLNELGNQLAGHGRLTQAEAKYRAALEIDPHLAIAWNNLGVVLLAQGEFTRATWAYGHAIDDDPGYALAYYNLGAAFESRDKFTPAVENYKKAFELDPKLLDLKHNPQIASNRLVAEALLKAYIDRGGSAILPVQSAYPSPSLPSRKPPARPH